MTEKVNREPYTKLPEFDHLTVHDSRFHFDDQLFISIGKELWPNATIRRTRNEQELATAIADPKSLTGDVGMVNNGFNALDHHQDTKERRTVRIDGKMVEKVPYAAAGLMWKYYGDLYLQKKHPELGKEERNMTHALIDKQYMALHDTVDNNDPPEVADKVNAGDVMGVSGRAFKQVQSYRPTWIDQPMPEGSPLDGAGKIDHKTLERQDAQFLKALPITTEFFDKIQTAAIKTVKDYDKGKPTPEKEQAFLRDLDNSDKIRMDLSEAHEWLTGATQERVQEVANSRPSINRRDKRIALVEEHRDKLKNAGDLAAKDPRWAKEFEGIPKESLAKMAVITGNYDLPWRSMVKRNGTDDPDQNQYHFALGLNPDGNVNIIPYNYDTGIRLPTPWGGKERDELQKITGVKDAEFTHTSGFVGSAGSWRGAAQMAAEAIRVHEFGSGHEAVVTRLKDRTLSVEPKGEKRLPSSLRFTTFGKDQEQTATEEESEKPKRTFPKKTSRNGARKRQRTVAQEQ